MIDANELADDDMDEQDRWLVRSYSRTKLSGPLLAERKRTEEFTSGRRLAIFGGMNLEIWHPKEMITTDTGCIFYIEPGGIRLDTTWYGNHTEEPTVRGGAFMHDDAERGVTFVTTHDRLNDTESLIKAIKHPGQVIVMFCINYSHFRIYESLKLAGKQVAGHHDLVRCWQPVTVVSTVPGVASTILTPDCRIMEIDESS